MSEMKQLEKTAKEAYVQQKIEALKEYIDGRFDQMVIDVGRQRKHSMYYMSAWGTWCLSILCFSVFGGTLLDLLHQAAFALFVGVMWAEWVIILPSIFGVRDELRGCFKTLEILGMLDAEDGGEKRLLKYKESIMEKIWRWAKTEKMRQAFA